MKGFIKDKKFHPITNSIGTRKARDSKEKTIGVRLKRTTKSSPTLTRGFKVGDIVPAFNGRIGQIIEFDIDGDDPEFNFARVATTFGGVMRVRISNLEHAVPKGVKTDEDGTVNPKGEFLKQLPVDQKSKEIIAEVIKNHSVKEKDFQNRFLNKTVTFQTGSKEFPPIKNRKGKVTEAQINFEGGLFGSDKSRLTVKVGDEEFSPLAEDVKIVG